MSIGRKWLAPMAMSIVQKLVAFVRFHFLFREMEILGALPSEAWLLIKKVIIVSVKLNLLAHQVASQETYGTLGAIVRSQTGSRQVGFLTNRHVAVDLDYPNQKMFHPLPPTLGPGVYLGAVERATSFITDELWYGIFAGINPGNDPCAAKIKYPW